MRAARCLWIATLLLVFTLLNSCGLIKTSQTNKIEEVTEQTIKLTKEAVNTKVNLDKAISEAYSKNYSEEITYKAPIRKTEIIELTASFRLDTSHILKGDTALKLIDINNSEVSVTVYQNRKTNQLTAKIVTNGKVSDIPFSSLSIKKNYSEKSSLVDSSKVLVETSSVKIDRLSKTKDLVKSKVVKKSNNLFIIAGIVFSVLGILIVLRLNRKKTK